MNIKMNIWDNENLIKTLKEGGVVVMPTDTIYGIVGRGDNPKTVARIYELKKRALDKKCITLIGDISELDKFSIHLEDKQKKEIEEAEVPTSFVVDDFSFRLPKDSFLQALLRQTGPLIAPSANLEGMSPAKNIEEAKAYFGNGVDLYVDGGELEGKASKIVRLHKDGSASIIRE